MNNAVAALAGFARQCTSTDWVSSTTKKRSF